MRTIEEIRQELHNGSVASGAGVFRVSHGMVNSYLVGRPDTGEWVLVDSGLTPFSGRKIIRHAEEIFGPGNKPAGIILTHGHFDHVGAVKALARFWQVPVYAHALELPYLTGLSAYPPPDPTVGGGGMARMAGLYPRKPIDLREYIDALPEDHTIPGLPEWRWVPTPGHTPGHISLWNEKDRTLIAGDAFVTVRQESAWAVVTQAPEVWRPPAYFTCDWVAARESVRLLASLEPEYAATGHGVPMSGAGLRADLHRLALEFDRI
ncbi:MAG TPA: MBL fold metallo-hydrolase, partial [Clostridia bacterium]|nr:MBL fold metallo-hydrolase [Clostridia bacterium]